jgi:hypothetical protein
VKVSRTVLKTSGTGDSLAEFNDMEVLTEKEAIAFVMESLDRKLIQAYSCLDLQKVVALSLIRQTLQGRLTIKALGRIKYFDIGKR